MLNTLVTSVLLTLAPNALQAAEQPEASLEPGLSLRVYDVGEDMSALPELVEGQTPNVSRLISSVDLTNQDFGLSNHFLAEIDGFLRVPETGRYGFRLSSDDGSELLIDGEQAVDHDGLHGFSRPKAGEVELTEGLHPIQVRFFEQAGWAGLRLEWKRPGSGEWELVPTEALRTEADQVRVTAPGRKRALLAGGELPGRPGDGQPLAAVHPGFDLVDLRPEGFEPRVGGMDFLSDGHLVMSVWEPSGAVYLISGATGNDAHASRVGVQTFARGLAEPLGVCVVPGARSSSGEDEIYVLQKQELTRLIDHDGDGDADEYRKVCDGWNVTGNFHEFAFGLVEKDGFFYAGLALAINQGGKTTEPQVENRGTVIRIDPRTGGFEVVAQGVRTPNGLGLGLGGELFVTENQGDWMPANKLNHIVEGGFYGSHIVPDHAWADRPPRPPVVWLPQGEIGNSPSEPVEVHEGPYAGQMIVGDVTHGGIKRVFIEEVDGALQGSVFRFTQGLEAGVNRLVWGPDGDLYVGMLGTRGNWSWKGKQFGFQKLSPNGETPFEMLAVRAMSNGLELEFTRPIGEGDGWNPAAYEVTDWRYEPTPRYGGPKIDERELDASSASVSPDRRRVFLEIPDLEPGRVVYVRLPRTLRDETGEAPWTTEAWYTLNALPTGRSGEVLEPPPANRLTDREREQGFRLLFDGESADGWRGYRAETFPEQGWDVIDGSLVRTARGGAIATEEAFGDFELVFDWQIEPGGNSGVFYRVTEDAPSPWMTGPEYQLLDNARHPNGKDPYTNAASVYDLYRPAGDATHPPGSWNTGRIIVAGPRVVHELNGHVVVEYDLSSDDWRQRLAASKFASYDGFAAAPRGHIVLQDHGDRVAFRNIKLREIPADEARSATGNPPAPGRQQ